MAGDASGKGLITDLTTSLAFCTRLPWVHSAAVEGPTSRAQAGRFQLVGALVGGLGALVYWLADGLYLDPILSSILAVAATVLITGALHEDGLADTADGFGARASRERKLDIMQRQRDRHLRHLGADSLLHAARRRPGESRRSGACRAGADRRACRRARTLPVFMRRVPNARQEGLSANVGEPPQQSALIAVLLGLLLLLLCLGLGASLVAALLLACAIGLMAWLCITQIGGQTGDVLGALEQVSEILILLVAAAWL